MLNRRLAVRAADGAETVTQLDGAALGEVLRRDFGLALGAADLTGIAAALAEARPGHIPVPG